MVILNGISFLILFQSLKMSFDFSDLVIQDDQFYNYDNFLSDPIYDWLKEPENVLNACDAIGEEKQQQQIIVKIMITIISIIKI